MRALKNSRRSLSLLALAAVILVGCSSSQPAPASSKPADAPKAAVGPLIIMDSMVRGSANLADAEKAAKSCVLTSRFLHNEEVVWRIKVIDPATGKSMDDKELSKVEVKFPDGKTFKTNWAPHGPKDKPTDWFWGAGWEIPEEYPAGSIAYTVTAEAKDGRKGVFVSVTMAPSLLTVADGKVPKVAKS